MLRNYVTECLTIIEIVADSTLPVASFTNMV